MDDMRPMMGKGGMDLELGGRFVRKKRKGG